MLKQKALQIVVDWCRLHGDSTAQEAAKELEGVSIEPSPSPWIPAVSEPEVAISDQIEQIIKTEIEVPENIEPVKPKRGRK